MPNKCLNPECNKDLPIDFKGHYCNEECLRKSIDIKKANKKEELTDIDISQDLNIHLILKAIETKTEITLIPRRTHTIKGIPLRFDSNTLRVYVNTGKSLDSVLLSEIGHFSFPMSLLQTDNK